MTLRTIGKGWIPDLPDHRDKLFATAAKESQTGSSELTAFAAVPMRQVLRARTIAEGWLLAESGLRERVERLGPRYVARFEHALEQAYPDDGSPFAAPRRPGLLLSRVPLPAELPGRVDLRPFMSPIEDQAEIGSCTAHAVIGLVEYLQIALTGDYVDASRLFLYKVTRNLLQWEGDTGAYIRTAFKGLRAFGVCPEEYLPYNVEDFDSEPSPFCYSFASNYQAHTYHRLQNLLQIKQCLAQGYPVAFGFTCYESIDVPEVAETGAIPLPSCLERTVGGHAVLAVGYIEEGRALDGEPRDGGYLIIRNSWSTDWGVDGYGFLPFSYINEDNALADDFWTLVRMDYPRLSDTRAAPFLVSRRNDGRPNNSQASSVLHYPFTHAGGRIQMHGPPIKKKAATTKKGSAKAKKKSGKAPKTAGTPPKKKSTSAAKLAGPPIKRKRGTA